MSSYEALWISCNSGRWDSCACKQRRQSSRFQKLYVGILFRIYVFRHADSPVWIPADKKCFTSKAVPKAAQKESLSYLVIKQIQAVYREEDKLKELKPEDRLRQHQVVIKPLVDALFAYLKSNERKVSTAKLKQTVTYAINQRLDKSRDI